MASLEKIILGTVQFGLNYGINNTTGKMAEAAVFDLFRFSQNKGLRLLDTADAYGNAVDLIGTYHQTAMQPFDVISKFKTKGTISPLDIEKLVDESLQRLNISQFFGYLYHSFADYEQHRWALEQLSALKMAGKIKYIGVSIYTNEQLATVANDTSIDLIQLPYNLLDNQTQRGELIALAKANGKIIHVRSVFLQGLFFKNIENLPPFLLPLKKYLNVIHEISKESQIAIADLALNYVVNNPLIDGVLIGVDTIQQLEMNLNALNTPLPQHIKGAVDAIRVTHINLLNPSNWL